MEMLEMMSLEEKLSKAKKEEWKNILQESSKYRSRQDMVEFGNYIINKKYFYCDLVKIITKEIKNGKNI